MFKVFFLVGGWSNMVCKSLNGSFTEEGLTPFALAMPDKYKQDDAVLAYRNYYKNEKSKICANYTNRDIPHFLL